MEEELLQFSRKRGIQEDIIFKMEENKIDRFVIQAMNEENLKAYLPIEGDRIAVLDFCKKFPDASKSSFSKRKKSLFNSLRRKLQLKIRNNSSDSDEEYPRKKSHLDGNKNAKKKTRKIEIGWLNYDPLTKSFKQVRNKNGGGTRKIDINKNANKDEIEAVAKRIFFSDGFSKLGSIDQFQTEIRDFSEEILTSIETVGEMYNRTGLNMLRFFLATAVKTDSEESFEADLEQSAKTESAVTTVTPVTTKSPLRSDDLTSFLTSGSHSPAHESTYLLPNTSTYLMPSTSSLSLNGTEFRTPDLSNDQLVLDESETEVFFNVGKEEFLSHNDTQMDSTLPLNEVHQDFTPFELNIHRGPMAFNEMIGYFKDPFFANRQLIINRILPNGEKEPGEDTGGILRDVLTEFWTEFYDKCTVGRLVKVPSLRHDFGSVEWKSAANILSYGYRFTGYYPIQIAKSFMLQCLAPSLQVQTSDLLRDFYNFISIPDRELFQKAEEDFPSVANDELIDALDMHECKTIPKAENFKAILLEIAHKELLQTPMFVCDCWKEILREINFSETKLNEMYEALKPSNKKVAQLLSFPEIMDSQSMEVSRYLRNYVNNLDPQKLSLFLRFCTGSDILSIEKINVEFTVTVGLSRRPIAHTCGCVLELSKIYESFMEFRSEFDNVLSAGVWVMDIV